MSPAAGAMPNSNMMAQQIPANYQTAAPRMSYHHPHPQQAAAGPRFPFFPPAHLVPQMYTVSPQYMMGPQQQPPRPRLIGGAVGPMGAHNLLGAPITPHTHQMPPVGLHQYAPSTVSPVTSSVNSSISPSPISPLQNWPGLPSAASSPSSNGTQDRSPPTANKTGTSHTSVQLLPNVCNATIEVRPELGSPGRPAASASYHPIITEPRPPGNGFNMPFNIDRKLLLQNAFLQRELSNYIKQTQGTLASHNFLRSIDPNYQPPPFKMNMVCGINKASKEVHTSNAQSDPRLASLAKTQNKEMRHRHETVSVKMEELSSSQDQQLDPDKLASAACGSALNSDPSILSARISSESGATRSSDYNSMMAFGKPAGLNNTSPQPRTKEEWILTGNHPNMHLPFGTAPPLHAPIANGAPHWDQMHNGVGQALPPNLKRKPGLSGSGRTIPPQNIIVPQRQQSSGSSSGGENHSEELLSDRELPSAVDHMVRYIEDSLEDKYSESDLGNIHIGHNPLKMSLSAPGGSTSRPANAETHAPLYMRRSSNSSMTSRNLSYAGALRSQPTPQPPHPEDTPTTTENPLDLLKNLNIKASPGTQAFYQYFS